MDDTYPLDALIARFTRRHAAGRHHTGSDWPDTGARGLQHHLLEWNNEYSGTRSISRRTP
jgi:hypothetical protein